jgi:serpin B
MSVSELNLYLYSYLSSLPSGEKYKVSVANSIWFTEDESFSVAQDFLQLNADYYGADIYKAPFDSGTLRDINNWVKKETDGMIPKVVDDIPSEAVMYLVNALAFDAEWMSVYEKDQVRDGEFTKEDGTKQRVEMMYSTEHNYLEDESATGFIKYYKGGKYAFAALLPNEGISLSDYIASLDGATLNSLLFDVKSTEVKTSIPKFEVDYDTELSMVLARMGMLDAFDVKQADFSNLGVYEGGNLYIDSVIHKTYIEVREKGTRAGAVTAVGKDGGAMPNPEKPKEVYLDRPFVYMLIDTENNIPFFIGSMTEIE